MMLLASSHRCVHRIVWLRAPWRYLEDVARSFTSFIHGIQATKEGSPSLAYLPVEYRVRILWRELRTFHLRLDGTSVSGQDSDADTAGVVMNQEDLVDTCESHRALLTIFSEYKVNGAFVLGSS